MGQSLNEPAKSRTARDIYNLSASAEGHGSAATDAGTPLTVGRRLSYRPTDDHRPATPGTPDIQKRQSEDWRFQKPYLLRLP